MKDENRESMRLVGDHAPIELPEVFDLLFAVAAASAVRGALGTVIFGTTFPDQNLPALLIVDWDLHPIEGALPHYIPSVFSRLKTLRTAHKVFHEPILLVEPRGLGKTVLLEGGKTDYPVHELPESLTKLDLADRATAALTYVHLGQVKFSRPAFEQTVNFRGTDRNHLRTQIAEYTIDQRADSAELLNAWCLGIIAKLEEPARK
ncbi:MAG TPA: hypothetical protein VGP20_02805 [Steroidobacteraceae bacterium]|jgi:hypothetical protein|nr:hypothetical protein [Steroidobacteraceae bacterium]